LPGGNLDAAVLSGRSANEVMNAVVEAIYGRSTELKMQKQVVRPSKTRYPNF
jgi:hypothetical protein